MKSKIATLFMAVFAVSQFGHVEKAEATTAETRAQKKSPFETTIHGGGCGCSNCSQETQIHSKDDLA